MGRSSQLILAVLEIQVGCLWFNLKIQLFYKASMVTLFFLDTTTLYAALSPWVSLSINIQEKLVAVSQISND